MDGQKIFVIRWRLAQQTLRLISLIFLTVPGFSNCAYGVKPEETENFLSTSLGLLSTFTSEQSAHNANLPVATKEESDRFFTEVISAILFPPESLHHLPENSSKNRTLQRQTPLHVLTDKKTQDSRPERTTKTPQNYRTFKPEKGGLFCAPLFPPESLWPPNKLIKFDVKAFCDEENNSQT